MVDAEYYIDGVITMVEEERLGQLKWFSGKENPNLFNKLNGRIETFTGFSTATSEGYQTVNYGAGGHFSVHLDAFTDVRIIVVTYHRYCFRYGCPSQKEINKIASNL